MWEDETNVASRRLPPPKGEKTILGRNFARMNIAKEANMYIYIYTVYIYIYIQDLCFFETVLFHQNLRVPPLPPPPRNQALTVKGLLRDHGG